MMPSMSRFIAAFVASDKVIFILGVGLTLLGIYLRWQLVYYSMRAEERAKDGLLSEDQARRHITLFRYSGPLVSAVGLGLLAYLVWR